MRVGNGTVRHRRSLTRDALDQRDLARDRPITPEPRQDGLPRRDAQRLAQRIGLEQRDGAPGKPVRIARIDEYAVHAVRNELAHRRRV
jgi:hypothetical protein